MKQASLSFAAVELTKPNSRANVDHSCRKYLTTTNSQLINSRHTSQPLSFKVKLLHGFNEYNTGMQITVNFLRLLQHRLYLFANCYSHTTKVFFKNCFWTFYISSYTSLEIQVGTLTAKFFLWCLMRVRGVEEEYIFLY